MKTNNTKSTNLTGLTEKLRNTDKRYAQVSKRLQYVYFVLVAIFIVVIIDEIIEQASALEIAGSTCILLAMFVAAIFFRHYQKEYNSVDYGQPTLLMLKWAAYRYQPFHWKILWLVPVVLLVDAGLVLGREFYVDKIWVHIVFLGSVAGGVIVGLVYWYVNYKPLRDEALQLIDEIENEPGE